MSTKPERPSGGDSLNESFETLGKDFDALGSVLEQEVEKAVSSLIGVAHSAVNSVTDGVRESFVGFQPAWQQYNTQRKEQVRAAKVKEEKAAKKAKRSPEALAKRANGEAAGAGGFALAAGIFIAVTLAQLPEFAMDPDAWIGMMVTGVFAVWFTWQTLAGWMKAKHLRRLTGYMSVLGDRTYITIQQIAASLGANELAVRSDLRKTLAHGLLQGAFLSPDGTRLFVSETAYRLYMSQQEEMQRTRAQAPAPQAAAQQPVQAAAPQGVVGECDVFMTALQERNARIANVQMSAHIETILRHTHRIRNWLTTHPQQENRVRRFTSYYLPTILKLLDTYCDLELHAVPGSVAQQSQKDIAEILSTIDTAFQTLENGLVQDTALDVSAEISALQTVMAQEGLTQEDDFAQVSPQL